MNSAEPLINYTNTKVLGENGKSGSTRMEGQRYLEYESQNMV